jgi:hypothetical protein
MTAGPWSEDEERLLAELLAGERRETELDVARVLRASPALRAEYESLRGIARGVGRSGAAARAERAEAAAAPAGLRDHSLVREALARELGASAPARRLPWGWLAAAALVAAAAAAISLLADRGEPADDTVLGPAAEWALQPEGAVADFATFRWQGEARGGYFVVRVYDADPAVSGRPPIATSGEVETTSWSPRGAQREAIDRHERIYWELVWVDAGSVERLVDAAEAWR